MRFKMIPKIIHYVWVGGSPLTELAQKCINSWKVYCPEYKIVEWNESNFSIASNRYCRQAYESGKWPFVSDYIRLKVLYDQGGIYLDTDMEVVRNLDKFLTHTAFSGFEGKEYIQTSIIASEAKGKWVRSMLDIYNDLDFILPNGEFDYTTNVSRITNKAKEIYPQLKFDNTIQCLDDMCLYPTMYFCPKDYFAAQKSSDWKKIKGSENVHALHHFAGSWVIKQYMSPWLKLKRFVAKIIGARMTAIISKLLLKIRGG